MTYDAQISEVGPDGPRNTIHIDFDRKTLLADLTVYFFEDNGYMINYVPALNLSSYGNTFDEARAMMLDVVLEDYFDAILEMPKSAVFEELSKYGWKIASRNTGDFENSSYVDRDGILRNFNLPEDTKIEEGVLSLA